MAICGWVTFGHPIAELFISWLEDSAGQQFSLSGWISRRKVLDGRRGRRRRVWDSAMEILLWGCFRSLATGKPAQQLVASLPVDLLALWTGQRLDRKGVGHILAYARNLIFDIRKERGDIIASIDANALNPAVLQRN